MPTLIDKFNQSKSNLLKAERILLSSIPDGLLTEKDKLKVILDKQYRRLLELISFWDTGNYISMFPYLVESREIYHGKRRLSTFCP